MKSCLSVRFPALGRFSLCPSSDSDIDPASCLLSLALQAPGQTHWRQLDGQAHQEVHTVPGGSHKYRSTLHLLWKVWGKDRPHQHKPFLSLCSHTSHKQRTRTAQGNSKLCCSRAMYPPENQYESQGRFLFLPKQGTSAEMMAVRGGTKDKGAGSRAQRQCVPAWWGPR